MPTEALPYLAGLVLEGRRVLVVGGGHVSQRRIPGLLTSGALVTVVAPEVTPAVEGLASAGDITWEPRPFEAGDLADVWYVITATDDPDTNAEVARLAEAGRIFCVRADHAGAGSARTPAAGHADDVSVGVLSSSAHRRRPRRSAAIRDAILDGLHAGTLGEHADPEPRPATGSVTLVGGGPGDAELLTLAARRALREADVVIADRLAPRDALGDLPADVELYDVTKLPRGRAAQQEEINRLIVEHARSGRRVVRFKGGDSFVFGRGYEEILACRELGIPVDVVPGISTPVAVPGLAGIPVTHRGVAHEFTVVSGHLPPGHERSLVDWDALAKLRGTLLLMMAVEHGPQIADALLVGGRDPGTPVAVVSDGSMPGQRTVLSTLADLTSDLAEQQVRPPAIIVVGDVVAVAHPDRYPDRHPHM